MLPAARLATYQDILDAPEHMIAEIIDGNLHLQPRPARRHAAVYALVGHRLVGAFDTDGTDGGVGGWVIRQEPELHLGGDVVVPDLAGWRLERYDSDNEDSAFFTIAPDWCCEILSPSTRHIDRQTKARIYLREGFGFYWLVDPDTREIEAFERSADGLWIWLGAYSGEQPVRIKPFDAIEIPLAKIWGR